MSQKENKTALVAKKNGSKTSITNFLKLAKYAEKYLEEETKLATEISRIKRLRKKLNLKKKHIIETARLYNLEIDDHLQISTKSKSQNQNLEPGNNSKVSQEEEELRLLSMLENLDYNLKKKN